MCKFVIHLLHETTFISANKTICLLGFLQFLVILADIAKKRIFLTLGEVAESMSLLSTFLTNYDSTN